jgi:hypothetical protein
MPRHWLVLAGALASSMIASEGRAGVEAEYQVRPAASDTCPEGDVGDIDVSCYGLWHERNRVLAEHGYCFQKERTIRVFGRACFPPYGALSESDRCYVQALQRLERANGCAGQ